MEPAESETPAVSAEDTPAPEPPSLETVHAWLAQARPADVLVLLRKPDFAYMTMTAFVGVRVNPTSYAMPLVRGRLAQEIIKNDKFAEKLRALADASLSAPAPAAAPVPATPPPPDRTLTDREQIKAERERAKILKVERDAARQALLEAEDAVRHAAQAQAAAESSRVDAEHLAGEQAHKISRLERRVTQMLQDAAALAAERDALQKAAKQTLPVSAAAERAVSVPVADMPSPWQTAAAHLLQKRKTDAVLLLAEEVLRLAPHDITALEIAAQVHETRQDATQAAAHLRTLLELAVTQRRVAEGPELWLRLIRYATPAQAGRSLRELLRALRPDHEEAVRQMRLVLARLHGFAPHAHAQVAAQITRDATPALAEALMPPPGALGAGDRLPLDLSVPTTAGALLAAVRAGDDAAVADARAALSRLETSHPGDYVRVQAVLEQAAADDPSLLQPLMRAPRGPVVVDASNVAYHGQEMLARPRPRLRPLLSMRRALLQRGYFPVLAIADANLPHTIDERLAFDQVQVRREVRLVDSGTVADEVLLREAKRLAAPLVTNDKMDDWDPLHQVTKIGFTLSLAGDVLFDS